MPAALSVKNTDSADELEWLKSLRANLSDMSDAEISRLFQLAGENEAAAHHVGDLKWRAKSDVIRELIDKAIERLDLEVRRAKMVPVYVIVEGEPSDSDDHFIPGFYEVKVDGDLTDEEKAEVALDHFHDNNGIACLDDFSIRVISEDGRWLPQMESYENRSLQDRGEYIGDFDDPQHLPSAVQTTLGLPNGPTL